jgi:heptosyltransferase-3
MRGAALFFGHDSGPMHLAAAVGLPCVAVFCARAKPGVWFPWGSRLKVIYHQTDCFGCELQVCSKYGKKCISSITVEEVLSAINELLAYPTTCNVEKSREGDGRPPGQYYPPIGNFRR